MTQDDAVAALIMGLMIAGLGILLGRREVSGWSIGSLYHFKQKRMAPNTFIQWVHGGTCMSFILVGGGFAVVGLYKLLAA